MASTTVSVRVSPEVKAGLRRLARATDRTGSQLASRAIADFVARETAIVGALEQGLDDARNGRVVSHVAAMARIRRTIARRGKAT